MSARRDDPKVTPLRPTAIVDLYNSEAEQLVLGALFMNNGLLPRLHLRPEDFGHATRQEMFAAAEELIKAGKLANPVTLKHQFDADVLKQLAEAGETVIFDEHAVEYARLLADLALKRETKVACDNFDFDLLAKTLERRNGHAAARSLVTYDAADIDPAKIPPRGWLLGTTFCRKFISGLIAEGGAGKTAVRYAQYLALATGRKLTDEHVHHRVRVLIVCLEDDLDEVRRRIAAAMIHHKVAPSDVRGWLHYCTPQGLKLLQNGQSGERVVGELYTEVRAKIETLKIDLVSFDPFVKAHGVEENDNNAIDEVCGMLAGLAAEFNCAIDLISHARKGAATPGDAERDRGAGAKKDAGRLMRTLTAMSPEEAATYGLSDQERRALVRVDDAKLNLTVKSAIAVWFKLVGVTLGNRTELYPNGDIVHTVERWTPPDAFAELTTATINQILDKIEAGPYEGGRYSSAPQAEGRAAWRAVQQFCADLNEKQCKHIIATWLKTGVLEKRDHEDPKDRHSHPSLFVVKRPGNTWEA